MLMTEQADRTGVVLPSVATYATMRGTAILLLLLRLIAAEEPLLDESEFSDNPSQPIAARPAVRTHPADTPEVVLSVKYEKGALNKIYLAQYRKESFTPVVSALPEPADVCLDLCHAGLGGAGCGSRCQELVPVGLKTALQATPNVTGYGSPRAATCPTLCDNHLGEPLCNCESFQPQQTETDVQTNFTAICQVFCASDGYTLRGCPSCALSTGVSRGVTTAASTRVLNTLEGWSAWCGLQCGQGQGGAACNCDRAPFI